MPGKLEQNVLRKMNLINVATYNIGHEVTKKQKPSHAGKLEESVLPKINVATDNIGREVKKRKRSKAGKTRANVYGMKFIDVTKTNMDTW